MNDKSNSEERKRREEEAQKREYDVDIKKSPERLDIDDLEKILKGTPKKDND